jgi:hypothetical protein
LRRSEMSGEMEIEIRVKWVFEGGSAVRCAARLVDKCRSRDFPSTGEIRVPLRGRDEHISYCLGCPSRDCEAMIAPKNRDVVSGGIISFLVVAAGS